MDVWNLHEFRVGLGFGVVASGALLLTGLAVTLLGRSRPLPLAGFAIAAGGLLSIADTRPVPNAVVLGVLGIGAAAALSYLPRVSLWYSLALAVPFAWVIGFHGGVVTGTWARALVTVAASGGAMLVTAFDDAWQDEAPSLTLLAVSALGMYATVPDTETIGGALGVVLPFLVLGWPLRVATLSRPGAAATVAMLVWAGAVGARGRPASIVGLVVCLGLLASTPAGDALFPRAGTRCRRWSRQSLILAMVTSHVLLVIAASRVVGKVSDPALAAVGGAVVAVGAVCIGARFRSIGMSTSRP